MAFDPKIDDIVTVHGSKYTFLWNEATAKNLHLVDAREGGEGIVYRVSDQKSSSEFYALKTFNNNLEPNFAKFIIDSTSKLSKHNKLSGLRVCDRKLVRSSSDCPESQLYSELKNSVLMPWISGYTWHDILAGHLNKQPPLNLDKSMCFTLAFTIAKVLAGLEKNGLAHCDIASGNIIFDLSKNLVELIDVEDMYFPNSEAPKRKPLGSKGYKHPNTKGGIWFAEGDRFAGAVLVCEILAWSNPQIRKYVDDDTFFSNEELGQYCDKYQAVFDELKSQYSTELASLFEIVWYSNNINLCPPISNWVKELSNYGDTQKPILQVSPQYLDFGIIENQKTQVLSISNSGKGILRGNVSESDNRWLSIRQRAFELHSQETCSVEILASSPSNLEPDSLLISNITVDSNAGQVDVALSGKTGHQLNVTPSNPWPAIGCVLIIIFIGIVLFLALIGVLSNSPTPLPTPITMNTQSIILEPPSIYSLTPSEILPSAPNQANLDTPTLNIPFKEQTKTKTPTILPITHPPTSTPTTDIWKGCNSIYKSRLNVGYKAFVSNNPPLRNRLRAGPYTSESIIGYIDPGEKVEILKGPSCSNRWVWWKVKSLENGEIGWTSEGDESNYWLVPLK